MERILTWWIKDCDAVRQYSFDCRCCFGERILTWWIKDCDSFKTRRGGWCGCLHKWENSDLMNKGLRRDFTLKRTPLSDEAGENSDLMNKGLRRLYTALRIRKTVFERILTWWIKDCDLYSKPLIVALQKLERILTWWIKDCDSFKTRRGGWCGCLHKWENSDLMNKGLRRSCYGYIYTYSLCERILTWWIKDCDWRCGGLLWVCWARERILTWWIKDCDYPFVV